MLKVTDIPDYKELDKIVIQKREEIGRVIFWANDHLDLMRRFSTEEYPLQQGVIQIEYPRAELLFSVAGQLVTIGLFYYGEHYLSFVWDTKEVSGNNVHIIDINRPDEWEEGKLDKYIRESCLTVDCLMYYMATYRETIVRTERVKQIVKKKKKGKKGSQQKFTYIGKHYITIPNTLPKETPEEKRKYERHTEAWKVRGFWRTYKKTGKRVWIEPGVRGPKAKRKKPEGKTYRLS